MRSEKEGSEDMAALSGSDLELVFSNEYAIR